MKYNPFMAATLLTDNINWFSKPIKLPIEYTEEIIENKIKYFLRRTNLVTDIMKVVPDAVDRCTIYIFNDHNDVDSLSSIQTPILNSSENQMLITEIMAEVYRVFADEVLQPKVKGEINAKMGRDKTGELEKKTWIAITRITEEVGHYTRLTEFPNKWTQPILDNMVYDQVESNWSWDNPEDIIYVANRCKIYLFQNEDYVNRIASIKGTMFNVQWSDLIEAEIMDQVYNAFADLTIQPKEEEE